MSNRRKSQSVDRSILPFVPDESRVKFPGRGIVECVEWSGCMATNGYGKVWLSNGRSEFAHRVSIALTSGVEPGRGVVCHRCNNRSCVNPDHLYVGTHKDNMRDALLADPPMMFKVTDEEVLEIRNRWSPGMAKALASEFGMSPSNIHRIVRGLSHTVRTPISQPQRCDD